MYTVQHLYFATASLGARGLPPTPPSVAATAAMAAAGVIGLAVGFAVKDTIENYIASIMLSIRQPFRPNDHVVIDDKEGRVLRLTSRATILMTLDGNHLRIPNATVFKAVILNYTRNPKRRFDFELGVDADDDPLAAIETGLATLKSHDFVLDDPAPFACIQQVGDSNIVILYAGWVDQEKTSYMQARSVALASVKTALEAAGFALPEPIYRLRFDNGAAMNISEATSQPAAETAPPKPTSRPQADISTMQPEEDIERQVDAERRGVRGELGRRVRPVPDLGQYDELRAVGRGRSDLGARGRDVGLLVGPDLKLAQRDSQRRRGAERRHEQRQAPHRARA